MNDWIKQSATYNKIVVSLFVALLSFLALRIYDKVDSLPDQFVAMERYLSDQIIIRDQYIKDTDRMWSAICDIQKDVKEILKRSRPECGDYSETRRNCLECGAKLEAPRRKASLPHGKHKLPNDHNDSGNHANFKESIP